MQNLQWYIEETYKSANYISSDFGHFLSYKNILTRNFFSYLSFIFLMNRCNDWLSCLYFSQQNIWLLPTACCFLEVSYFPCKVWMKRTTLRCQTAWLTLHSLASWVWTNACALYWPFQQRSVPAGWLDRITHRSRFSNLEKVHSKGENI